MNPEKIGKQIAKRLLIEQFTEKVSLYPGAFKPPHKGHVATALKAIDDQTDKVIILMSTKERDGISVEQAQQVWDLYKQNTPELEKVEIIQTPVPVKDVYDYAKDNPAHDIRAVFGKGEQERFQLLLDKEKYPHVEVFDAGMEGTYSATDLRKAIRDNDLETISEFIPDGINVDDFMSIFQTNEVIKEGPQFGVLYHFTQELPKVISQNTLRGPVSLTRSLDSHVSEWLGDQPLLILDKDKLRTKYKIRPFKDTSQDDDFEDIEQYDEMEEVIDRDITNLNQYLIKVVLPYPDEVWEEYLKEKNIPYEYKNSLNEAIVRDKIVCDNCGWNWKIVDGGDDLYMCHKCGHDNTPRKDYLQEARYKKFLNEGWDSSKGKVIGDFVNYASEYLSVDKPKIKLINSPEYTEQYSSFGGYLPSEEKIMVVVNNRNMADILRTVAHEMVHHMQNLDNRLDPKSGEDGSPEENEANSLAGVIMRQFGRDNKHIYEQI